MKSQLKNQYTDNC